MIRTISRRLERLETRAAATAAGETEPHTIVFFDAQRRVTSAMVWDALNRKWVEEVPQNIAGLRPETGAQD